VGQARGGREAADADAVDGQRVQRRMPGAGGHGCVDGAGGGGGALGLGVCGVGSVRLSVADSSTAILHLANRPLSSELSSHHQPAPPTTRRTV